MTHAGVHDPFLTSGQIGSEVEDPERITGGRYRLPDLDGSPRKGGWQRVTTLVKAIGDARMLDLWHQRELIRGLVLRPDLYDLACATLSTTTDVGALRAELETLASRILMAAGADAGANTGTAFHGFTEAQDTGLMHYARAKWHGKLRSYAEGLTAHQLKAVPAYVERRVVILRYGCAGTLDRLLWDEIAGTHRVGDLKSQKRFWTWLEISAQLAAYQMADAMWSREGLCYVEMPEVADDLAVVAWMPVEHPDDGDRVDFFDVDLEAGREHLEVCYKVDQLRSAARSVNQTIGLLRPVPELSRVQAYARRLDSVASPSEGSALWAEVTAQGLSDTPELIELAMDKAQYFSGAQS